ncbi:MAG TPA: DNA mismatch repair protein MutS [Candidatus Faecousia excrementigallinarum]|uniref:DNA mismatch repair protein MutS n=1 Tax=Candidatus Faecousia excrementigallinarum TaxID=2840806 RepID=A0A9D1CLU3_9FIRM|nr:DNA mismatch repair protein MutS [Candidatus Faecousia excrementigallinarum]
MEEKNTELTPMRKQYYAIKEQNKDCILFFRLGDFYEMFDEDARLAARELDLTLTTRDRNKPKEEQTPMCGVPYHSVDSYIARLVSKGYKVAICEQTEDPALAKGLVEREVTRIVTPGTVTESCMLEESKNNYIACIYGEKQSSGLAFCDLSTGAFYVTSCPDAPSAACELGRFAPSEVIRGGAASHDPVLEDALFHRLSCCVDEEQPGQFSPADSQEVLESHFGEPLSELGLTGLPEAVLAAGTLLRTLLTLQKNDLTHIRQLQYYTSGKFMELDMDARRNLELTETLRSKEKKGTLLWVLDKTHTAMGGRLLRSWIEKPLLDGGEIYRRQSAVEELVSATAVRGELEEALRDVSDLERVMTRIVTGTVNCRDLLGLAKGLRALPQVKRQLQELESPLLVSLNGEIDPLEDCAERIEATIVDEPPLTVREGGIIREGADPQADHLRSIMKGGSDTIAAIEAAEREKTGIRTLKVGYNRVFGYYIEVSKSFVNQVPEGYIRKQTLTNCERYITQELKDLEDQVLGAKERLTALEYQIFTQLREFLAEQAARVQRSAAAVAQADVLCSLASVAAQRGYCRPEITLDREISITDGRHPVVELMLKDALFVPNDTHIGSKDNQVSIITGPNMAGKSTYMRQVALIVLMAQIGSFVPARSARIGIVDRVFTRIGASDDLASGQSTFMVEMAEVASILKYATAKSLLILDEIGRGTSTYDGMAIARAVLEYAANPRQLGAKTLFATHYHELSAIENELPNVKNYNIAVKKRGDRMIFLRKIVPGATDDSYGVEVAKLAGLPNSVVARARQILQELEAQDGVRPQAASVKEPEDQISMLDLRSQQVCAALEKISIETLTPIEAINELFKLKKMLE